MVASIAASSASGFAGSGLAAKAGRARVRIMKASRMRRMVKDCSRAFAVAYQIKTYDDNMLRALMVALLLATPDGAATPIAGEYYQGDGTGLNWTLNLNDDHTFTYKWIVCVGEYG